MGKHNKKCSIRGFAIASKAIIKSKVVGLRCLLERNKIFIDLFSLVILGILGFVISFSSLKVNKRTADIYERQLKILENEGSPYFSVECENICEKVAETEGTDKIAIFKYTLTNNGGNIRNVKITLRSQLLFYFPTGREGEWYIFQYMTNNFGVGVGIKPPREIEKDRKFIFYEYGSEDNMYENYDMTWLKEYLEKSFNIDNIPISYDNLIKIYYTDYMGESRIKTFELSSDELYNVDENLEYILVGMNPEAMVHDSEGNLIRTPIDVNDRKALGEFIKGDIEDWLRNNKGAKGYKPKSRGFYDLEISN